MKKAVIFVATCIALIVININIFAEDTAYIVKAGDTLWKIATSRNVDWGELALYNNLKTPHLIYPSQRIRFPDKMYYLNTIKRIQGYDEIVKTALVESVKTGQFKGERLIIYYEMISFLSYYYCEYGEDDEILSVIRTLIADAETMWDEKTGGYWDGSVLYPEYMRTCMYTRALADTILNMQKIDKDLVDKEWLRILKRNADWLLGDSIALVRINANEMNVLKPSKYIRYYDGKIYDLKKHSHSGNQNVAKLSALNKAYRVLGDQKYRDAAMQEWEYICENQWVDVNKDEGYITEHGNFDVGYSQVVLWLLGDYYFETKDSNVSEKLVKIWNSVKVRIVNKEYLLDTSDSYIIKDAVATVNMPTVFYLGIPDFYTNFDIGIYLLDNKYKIELQDGLLDSRGVSHLGLTASDYYLRVSSVRMYILSRMPVLKDGFE